MANGQKNRIDVTIHGTSYKIIGTESVEQIRLVASLVNDKMTEISEMNPNLDTARLAVLTAVNAVNEYVELQKYVEQLEQELKKLKG
ncbi:cell division protein ZapA [Caryophanon tenue]|uniref:Cell division protein ZapA n=1 Tax=Caryophanon tenue TaxID=33978 RepID=A0A1C0YMI3_9BACL|nr:cell division protein ZapA [Caryophanon tenue]OCS88385.1 cell division protein ZapA [Caryophanon tenue]